MQKFPEAMRQAFEQSLAQSLALDLTRDHDGYYKSAKTGNLFLAFCYGWYQGEGHLKALPILLEEIKQRVTATMVNGKGVER